jgi:ATP-binding cassette subfamily B protein
MSVCIRRGIECSQYEERHSFASNLLNGNIVDSIANHFSWKLFVNEKFEYDNINKYQQEEVITAQKSQKQVAKLHSILSVFTVILSIGGINALGYYYWQLGDISVGDFVFVINSTLGIEMLAWAVGLQLSNIFIDIGACKQAFSLIAEETHVSDIPNAKDLVVSKGTISFRDVSFGYNSQLLFENLSAEINSKEKIGLVGCSGSGKTTFCNLILRLYDVISGAIFIDNQNISSVTQYSLRKSISIVPQDPVLFHRSIRENIIYGDVNATSQQIDEIVKKAHIGELIETKGYDFNVGESGSRLSKGQRQRIAITRAMLKNAPILFLDEATSAMDSISEKAIQESLKEIMKDKTVIAIAHRLSTLKQMDRIFVFDKGKIIEVGAHEELLSQKGIYHQMWQAQIDGFIGG